MNPITTISTHCNAFKKAVNAAVQEKKKIKIKNEAIPLGTKIYENPRREEIISELAHPIYQIPPAMQWHGTHYPLVAEQIEQGQFESQGKDIYTTNDIGVAQIFGRATANKEAFRTGGKSDPVTLGIVSEAGTAMNAYRQFYFDGGSKKPVYILEAYRKEDDEQPSSAMATALSVYQVARDTYYQEIGDRE